MISNGDGSAPPLMGPVASFVNEFRAIGRVADIENFAPPRISFRLTQINEFISRITELFPVAVTLPSRSRIVERE